LLSACDLGVQQCLHQPFKISKQAGRRLPARRYHDPDGSDIGDRGDEPRRVAISASRRAACATAHQSQNGGNRFPPPRVLDDDAADGICRSGHDRNEAYT
jgi:hypothetical protein